MKLIKKTRNIIEKFAGLKVAVLGLTFKPGTNDIRGSPSISNINYLVEREVNVWAYDPVDIQNAKNIFGDKINYTESIYEAIKDVDVCFIMTE